MAPEITGAAGDPLTTAEDTPLPILIDSVATTDGDNLRPDLKLVIEQGANYTVTTVSGPAPTIAPDANYSGPLTVNVRVTDLTSQSAPFPLTVTVTPVPDAPEFTSTAVTAAAQDAEYSYAVTTADLDGGAQRTITAPTKPAWLELVDNGDGTATLSGTPGGVEVGAHNVTLEVRDPADPPELLGSQSFTITVGDVNDAPAFASTAITSATAGTAYTYAIERAMPTAATLGRSRPRHLHG
jgi:hypothetical protein